MSLLATCGTARLPPPVRPAGPFVPQPFTDEETQAGAANRALAAARECFASSKTLPSYAVGLEGGVCLRKAEGGDGSDTSEHLECFAWMAVCRPALDAASGAVVAQQWGRARTASFVLPPEIARLVQGGMELGHADDLVFKRTSSKTKDGAVGLLSHGLIDRKQYYEFALILALVPFVNPELYGSGEDSAAGAAAGAVATGAAATGAAAAAAAAATTK